MENDSIRIWVGTQILIALISAEKPPRSVKTAFLSFTLKNVNSEESHNPLKLNSVNIL